MTSSEKIKELLARAGLTINGPNPYDPQVHDERLYDRVLAGGTLALGEAYMDGWWDCEALDEMFARATRARLDQHVKTASFALHVLRSKLFNMQSKARATQVAEEHYDLGNDLYERMLDSDTMAYTCGYWKDATTLAEAQKAKFDLICRKIGLKKGDRVLDIGCGFGGFAKYAAEHYGATVVGSSVSKEQCAIAEGRTQHLPVEVRFEDYRDTKGEFDHVVSIGMFEAVGSKNFRTFMQKAHDLLKPGGFFLLHTIGANMSHVANDQWYEKYIFKNGMLPSVAQIGTAVENLFVVEDWHNFGGYYDLTLQAWFKNFDAAWPELKDKYGERFYRMWKYYLLQSAGSFRSRNINLWQVLLSKGGVSGVYQTVR